MTRPRQRSLVVVGGVKGFYSRAATLDQADGILADASLLEAREIAALVPDARIAREGLFGLPTSVVAVR